MQAYTFDHYGTTDALQLRDIDQPSCAPGEVLVKIHTTSINDWDWCLLRGKPYSYRPILGWFSPRVRIPGAEVAGVVESVGTDVAEFAEGDRVYGDLSDCGFGGFAEYVAAPTSALRKMPDNMSFEQAAAIPHAGLLALQGLELGELRDGMHILFNGAGGGVGTLGIQIARKYDVEVTGVDSGDKLPMLQALGFDHLIDYREEDFTTHAERYDLILECKSNRPASHYARALKPGGAYVTVGGETPSILRIVAASPFYARLRNKRLRMLPLVPSKGLEKLSQLYADGKLQCIIDGPHAFSDLPQALQRFGEAKHKGKVVITVCAELSA